MTAGSTGSDWPAARWLRERATTTPGRLRLAAVLLAICAVLFGVVATAATVARRNSANAVAHQTEPLLVEADGLYASLSDAEATAATTFLTGGIEPTARRQRYLDDLRAASSQLTALTRQADTSAAAQAAVSTIAAQLPVYSGLVETARANNREGLPIGAAYLRQASDLMRQTILPSAGRLYAVEAQRLGSDYRSGTSAATLVVCVAVAVATLALLALVQLYVTRRTQRILNVPMVLATVVLVGLFAWLLAGFVIEQNALATAQRNGSDSVQVLSAIRILASRTQGDESLALVARGGDAQDLEDFDTVMGVLEPAKRGGGLLAEAAALAKRSGSSSAVADLESTFGSYRDVHRRIAALETSGQVGAAVRLAVGPSPVEAPLSDRLNADVSRQITDSQGRFASAAADATSALGGLWLAIPLLVVIAALLALLGLAQRINEYR